MATTVFEPSYGSIGALYATFKSALTTGLDENSVVRLSVNKTVILAPDDSSFLGVVKAIQAGDNTATVQVAGYTTVAYSGDPPTAGIVRLASDGTGGVKVGIGMGFYYNVVNVDTVNSQLTLLLIPVPEITDVSMDLVGPGVGAVMANFNSALTPGTDEGKVVRQSGSINKTAILVPNGSSVIDGVVKTIDPVTFVVTVQIRGVVEVPYTGTTAPALGGEQLESNGAGGVKKGTGGGYRYLIYDVNTTDNLLTFLLGPKQYEVS